MKKKFLYFVFLLLLNFNIFAYSKSLNKYFVSINYELVEDLLISSKNEKFEKIQKLEKKFNEELLILNNENENFKIKEILNELQQNFIDNKAAQINYSIDEILKNNYFENNDLKKERLKTAFICETSFDGYIENVDELENIVKARIKFIEFLLDESDESKKFLNFIFKKLKRIKKIESKIKDYQERIKIKILETKKFKEGIKYLYSYLKNFRMNLGAGIVMASDIAILNFIKIIQIFQREIVLNTNFNNFKKKKMQNGVPQLDSIDSLKMRENIFVNFEDYTPHENYKSLLEDKTKVEFKVRAQKELNEIANIKTNLFLDNFLNTVDSLYFHINYENIKKFYKYIIFEEDLNFLKKSIFIIVPPLIITGIPTLFFYLNYKFLYKDKYLTPKIFEEYADLIKEKNSLIKSIYNKFNELSEKIIELKNIPEKNLMNLVLNSKECKKNEDKFFFNKLDRLISVFHAYKICDYGDKLLKDFNFDILKDSFPNKVFPFNIYEKFLGFIEFSIFKAKLIKKSKNNLCSVYLDKNGETCIQKDNNYFSIPIFNEKNDLFINNNFNIKNVWHPAFPNFVSNDINFENKNERNGLIIAPTGTGKSTFLMQLLSFLIFSRIGIVPAEKAELIFPKKIIQNLVSINGEIGSGTSKHLEERRFINEINSLTINNKEAYFYIIADEICSGTTRKQTERFVKELLSKTFLQENVSIFLTTHIEEIFENINMNNTVLFNIEVIRNGPNGDFTLTRKLKRGAGFWMDPENKDIQNEFILYLQKLENKVKN